MTPENLPLPRLQLRWDRQPDVETVPEWICFYELCIPTRGRGDIRDEEGRGYIAIEISRTKSGGPKSKVCDGKVSTPFRDGAHIKWDSIALGDLPMYAMSEGVVTKLDPPDYGERTTVRLDFGFAP